MRSYTTLRKEREEFRRRLVQLIIKKDSEETDSKCFPSADEMELLRYYYYIHHGIDTIHIAPIEKSWLQHIYALVPEKLKKQTEGLHKLTTEMQVCNNVMIDSDQENLFPT